jgi:DNA-binding beta-propeller fold protein YncE
LPQRAETRGDAREWRAGTHFFPRDATRACYVPAKRKGPPMPFTRSPRLTCLALVAALLAASSAFAGSFVTFESGQVRPLALSPDGTKLFAVNTPDDRLEIFDVTSGTPVHTGSVTVGMEPVAVAARTNTEVWVVNHLSDSVSVVSIAPPAPRVVNTIVTYDEPRDIVFALGGLRAYVTTANRYWASSSSVQTTPGIGRAAVMRYLISPSGAVSGSSFPILFTDTPRALAVTPDGFTVYAAGFQTGNQTTSISEPQVCNGGAAATPCTLDNVDHYPGGLPAPNANVQSIAAPETGLIVQYDEASGEWRDELLRDWSEGVKFSLPDTDVFAIDGNTGVVTGSIAHVGTILYDMAVNPVSGKLYVTNTEARNAARFEGPGILAGHSVRGHLHESRITVIDGGVATPRHLNKHIDYGVVPSPPGVKEKSLSLPLGMAVSSDGATLYVAAMGSNAIGVFDTTELENDTFVPDAADHIPVSGGGPTGLVLDEARDRLYVLTRFDNAVTTIDLATKTEIGVAALHNPEPAKVVAGRRFLYDAAYTTSNGESPCGSCHVFGDFDSLAWDLGNPDGLVENNTNPFRVSNPFDMSQPKFHPMKGPMTTQSLRGMAHDGPMHWRGDRRKLNEPLDEEGAFKAFNGAFDDLLGRGSQLTAAEMQQFTDFILEVTYPPNPLRNLDDTLSDSEERGRDIFFNRDPMDTFQTCNGCHRLAPEVHAFGTDGFSSFENEVQLFKIPHLRNLYQKVGMFGMAWSFFFNQGDNGFKGPQVRGFGFMHDGSADTLFRFMHSFAFNQRPAPFFNVGFPMTGEGDQMRRDVEAFLLVFDSDLKPVVGQQVTSSSTADLNTVPNVGFLWDRSSAGDCDLVVKQLDTGGRERGWVRIGNGFRADAANAGSISYTALRALATTTRPQTFTCVPPGSGYRIGIDRDEDGAYDFDELVAGTDPTSPDGARPASAKKVMIKNTIPDDEAKRSAVVQMKDAAIVMPPVGSASDPRCNGAPSGTVKATLTLASATSGQSHASPLPCQLWRLIGAEENAQGYKYVDKTLATGTVKQLTWRRGKNLKATLSGKGASTLGYDLVVGTSETELRGSLVSGDAGVCFACNAARDGSDGRLYSAKTGECPAPATCMP